MTKKQQDVVEEVGRRVRVLRESAGMSQRDLSVEVAKQGGWIGQQTISRVEDGGSALTLHGAWLIARAVGGDLSLFELEERSGFEEFARSLHKARVEAILNGGTR